MRPVMTLYTSRSAFDDLHSLADTKRKEVRVPRELLLNLLMDHSKLVEYVERAGPINHGRVERIVIKERKTRKNKQVAAPKRVRIAA